MTAGATYTHPRLVLDALHHDPHRGQRIERLRALGLGSRPEPEFDRFAAELAHRAGRLLHCHPPFAMVNFIGSQQYFAGLYTPPHINHASASSADQETAEEMGMSRELQVDRGWCSAVVERRKPLVLNDVHSHAKYATNRQVEEAHIRTYAGAPLFDPSTGTALGTVCVVDTARREWGKEGLELVKFKANEMMELLRQRGAPRYPSSR